jgi:hypothetical protein
VPLKFNCRADAQSRIDELYMNRHIDKAEWSRLFDELSPKEPLTMAAAVEPLELVEA